MKILDWANGLDVPTGATHVLAHCSAHGLSVAVPKLGTLLRLQLRDILIDLGHSPSDAAQFVYTTTLDQQRWREVYAETLLRCYRKHHSIPDPRLIGAFDRVMPGRLGLLRIVARQ